MKSYKLKEMFYSLQGEGDRAGRPSVFIRFSGCNLWSGREEDRETAVCKFCDTDFIGGVRLTPVEVVERAHALWPGGGTPYAVLTGGEPALQVDSELTTALRDGGFELAIETNGTVPLRGHFDWVTVSPKVPVEQLSLRAGNELKLVHPQEELDPRTFASLDFDLFYLQPKDCTDLATNTKLALEYSLSHPQWRLSTQLHKLWEIR